MEENDTFETSAFLTVQLGIRHIPEYLDLQQQQQQQQCHENLK